MWSFKDRHRGKGIGRRVKAALAAGVLALSQVLGMAAPMAQTAMAAEGWVQLADGGVTVHADGTLTGSCQITDAHVNGSEFWGSVYMPDGNTYSIGCYAVIEHPNNHSSYAGPCCGTYDFTAHPQGDGSYRVIIDSDEADGPAPGVVNDYIGYQRTYFDGWQVQLTGRVKLHKSSSNEGVSGSNGCYSLEGAKYGVYSDVACTQGVGAATRWTPRRTRLRSTRARRRCCKSPTRRRTTRPS